GKQSDAVQIKSISVSPDPPRIGAELTVTVDVEADGAMADVLVKVGRIKLLQKTFDICEEACTQRKLQHKMPRRVGPYLIIQTVDLSKEVPKGAFALLWYIACR
ncbi:hypothetical protein C8R45DRAFT_834750, partial [Mycena sanguinolenta]